jgi:hypothetical protein
LGPSFKSNIPRLTLELYRTLLTSSAGLEQAKQLVTAYKQGKVQQMTPELWQAKKTIDSTLHPGMGLIYGLAQMAS